MTHIRRPRGPWLAEILARLKVSFGRLPPHRTRSSQMPAVMAVGVRLLTPVGGNDLKILYYALIRPD